MKEKYVERDNTIDIAKAIGIILVVFAHTSTVYQSKVGSCIYLFHLPLFFFLSGVVFNEKKIENYTQYVKKKLKSLYLPFIGFEILFLLMHNFFWKIGIYTRRSEFTGVYTFRQHIIMFLKIVVMGGGEQLAGPLWFLISSLEIALWFGLIVICLKKTKYKYIKLFVVSLLGFIVGNYFELPRMGSQSLIGTLFFCFGYFYRLNKNKIKVERYWGFISGVIVIVLGRNFKTDIAMLKIDSPVALIVGGLSGILVTLCISEKLDQILGDGIKNILLYCGRNTIWILALHCLFFKVVSYIQCIWYNLPLEKVGIFPTFEVVWLWCPLYCLAGVMGPLGAKYIVDGLMRKEKI